MSDRRGIHIDLVLPEARGRLRHSGIHTFVAAPVDGGPTGFFQNTGIVATSYKLTLWGQVGRHKPVILDSISFGPVEPRKTLAIRKLSGTMRGRAGQKVRSWLDTEAFPEPAGGKRGALPAGTGGEASDEV